MAHFEKTISEETGFIPAVFLRLKNAVFSLKTEITQTGIWLYITAAPVFCLWTAMAMCTL